MYCYLGVKTNFEASFDVSKKLKLLSEKKTFKKVEKLKFILFSFFTEQKN